MRKRLLAIVATMAMVVAMVPAMAFAAPVTTEAELSAAFAAGGDIELESDVTIAGKLTVPAGKTVNLDLNGYTISGVCNASQATLIMVENTGTLNVKDSSSAGTGKITYAAGTSNVGWTVDVKGNFNLYSGTIELTGSWSIGYAVDVRPNSWGSEYTEGTVFHMYGGKLVSSDGAVRVASSSDEAHEKVSATFIMDGGEIDAAWDGIFIQQSNAYYDVLNVTINNGKISSDLAPVRFYGPAKENAVGNTEEPIKVDISGGTFEYTGNDTSGTWLVPGAFKVGGGMTTDELLEETTLEITGGNFEGDVSEFIPEGYEQDSTGEVINPNAPSAGGEGTSTPAPEKSPATGDNSMAPFAVAGLALAAMAVAVVTRRRTN